MTVGFKKKITMEKQTAIEWLILKLEPHLYPDFELVDLINQAKEMEKQQIIKAHNVGSKWGFEDVLEEGEQYYKETYENK
jgi:hypothetical protein